MDSGKIRSPPGSLTEISPELSRTSLPGSPPGVTMEELPFYEVCAEIVKPTRLVPKKSFISKKTILSFVASSRMLDQIFSSRMCLWNTFHPQMDRFPLDLRVRVNWQSLEWGGTEPNRSAHPLNITHLTHLSDRVANRILISWSPKEKRVFAGAVYLVMKLTADDLLEKLWAESILPADKTRALIQENLEGSSGEPTTSSLRISLMCPLGQNRVTVPCRSLSCSHVEIFDVIQYLKKNEKEETWMCPVCNTHAPFSKLALDRYFLDILNTNISCEEIVVHQDGSWSPIPSEKNLIDYSDESYKGYRRETASFSPTKSSSSEGEREFEHAPKRPCPVTATAILAAKTRATCSSEIELPCSPCGGLGMEVKKEDEGVAGLLPRPPASLLPSSSASTMELELPVTVQRPDQARDIQTTNQESPGSGSLITQMVNYTQEKNLSMYRECFKQCDVSSHLTSPKTSQSHFSVRLPDSDPKPFSLLMSVKSTCHKWSPPFCFDLDDGEEEEDESLAPGLLTPKAQMTPSAGPMGDTIGRADPGMGTFSTPAGQAPSSRASSGFFSRVQQGLVPKAGSASSFRTSRPWLTSERWPLVNRRGKVLSIRPKQGWASSTQVRGASSTRVTEAFFPRAKEASSSRAGEASFSRPSEAFSSMTGNAFFSRPSEAFSSREREAAASSSSEAFLSTVREASSSLLNEASSPRAREAFFSTGREVSSSRVSEPSFPRLREVSSSRTTEAFFSRVREASSSRASEAFPSRVSEAFSSRASEPSFSKASETSFSKVRKTSSSRTSEAFFSRAREAFFSRAREASSSSGAVGGQSMQAGGDASYLDSDETEAHEIL
uniref:SP-RING-type domain-containing protein n=1 Tax=Ornithorhynchus anatinus TaxID=9258 RepID=K7E889_ORNAN